MFHKGRQLLVHGACYNIAQCSLSVLLKYAGTGGHVSLFQRRRGILTFLLPAFFTLLILIFHEDLMPLLLQSALCVGGPHLGGEPVGFLHICHLGIALGVLFFFCKKGLFRNTVVIYPDLFVVGTGLRLVRGAGSYWFCGGFYGRRFTPLREGLRELVFIYFFVGIGDFGGSYKIIGAA